MGISVPMNNLKLAQYAASELLLLLHKKMLLAANFLRNFLIIVKRNGEIWTKLFDWRPKF